MTWHRRRAHRQYQTKCRESTKKDTLLCRSSLHYRSCRISGRQLATRKRPSNGVPYNKTPELSWGRQSPQLTPTPSPSPSPKTSHRQLQSFPTPPDTSPMREDPASASPNKPAATRRRPRHQRASQILKQPSHTMLRRSRARVGRAQERCFWELDASGRKARRIVE